MKYKKIHRNVQVVCLKAGEIALQHQRDGLQVNRKHDGDDATAVVTAADIAVDTLLRETLTKQYPDFGWLSEETADNTERLDKEFVWVVDPIDGTGSYIKGNDYYAISVGLVRNGVPVLGVVFNPARRELFSAYTGGGAMLNGQYAFRNFPATLANATCLVSINETAKGAWDPYKDLVNTKGVDSIAYKLAAAATTSLGDAVVTLQPKNEYDICAGHAICNSIGLIVTDIQGNPIPYNKPNLEAPAIIAAPDGLHQELLAVLNS
jgi:myo-inositol-1(or 4)-monophosphatase